MLDAQGDIYARMSALLLDYDASAGRKLDERTRTRYGTIRSLLRLLMNTVEAVELLCCDASAPPWGG